LEDVLLQEVRDLGGRKAKKHEGGVEFDASNKAAYGVLYNMRTAHRLYLRVDEFRARDLPEIYNKTRRINWERLLGPEHRVSITAYSIASRETHTDKIAESVGHALREHFEEDLGKDAPQIVQKTADHAGEAADQLLMARVEDNRCTLNLDASGELLFRRGWRTDQGAAPLRESYAAAMLRAMEWSPDEPVLDPMCGSGTIAIEAATIAAGLAPGANRSFQLQTWANFRPEAWEAATASDTNEAVAASIAASDADADVLEVARANAERAGVALTFEQRSVAGIQPHAESGLILTNAPYGVRLEGNPMEPIHRLCEVFDARFSNWRMGVLTHRDVTLPLARKRTTALLDFRNGGIPVRLWAVDA
jgi:putative N6-adenine-specific DNA methylase